MFGAPVLQITYFRVVLFGISVSYRHWSQGIEAEQVSTWAWESRRPKLAPIPFAECRAEMGFVCVGGGWAFCDWVHCLVCFLKCFVLGRPEPPVWGFYFLFFFFAVFCVVWGALRNIHYKSNGVLMGVSLEMFSSPSRLLTGKQACIHGRRRKPWQLVTWSRNVSPAWNQ